ncbi:MULTISPECIES: hypothetical protein [Mycobacterium]|nr:MULTISPECIES: hypothetical protein [Mycobacterium]MDP7726874.1 hypothetical protein [Mycobacterium sp. TY813]
MSEWYEIEMKFTLGENDPDDHDSFEAFLDSVTDELANNGVDADYTATAADLRASWTIEVPDGSEASLISALKALSAALSAVGCFEDPEAPAGHPQGHEVLGARRYAMA